jgi:hypothetical protein
MLRYSCCGKFDEPRHLSFAFKSVMARSLDRSLLYSLHALLGQSAIRYIQHFVLLVPYIILVFY